MPKPEQPALAETFIEQTATRPDAPGTVGEKKPRPKPATPQPRPKRKNPAAEPPIEATQPTNRSAAPAGKSGSKPKPDLPIPKQLGGYQILGELGRGAMGAVYRARQISLDREVALKTILGQWAKEPRMIARFTREAYAAAQLTHHNVVQIYDLGVDDGTHFFAMEFVRGRPLSDLVKEQGRLDPELAVSFILQAARGLQAAHSHGMVHRDVKPANLLISDDGIVKVADLGLVKIATDENLDSDVDVNSALAGAKANITMANVAIGTAAFMAPEQADNAAAVDHRADIYSLGCTLYSLITGRFPFQGTTALEVISKHRSEPIVRPDAIVDRVPEGLSEIVVRLVAKQPADRPANMGQVVEELERFLGVQSGGEGFSPSEEHANTLQECVNEFNKSPTARLRSLVGYGFPIVCGAAGLLSLIVSPLLAGGIVACGVSAVLAYFVISGIRDRTDLFAEARGVAARSSWSDRLTWLGGLLLLLAVAWAIGTLWVWLLAAAVGTGLAFGFHFFFDSRLQKDRAVGLKKAEDLLRSMRLRGLSEHSVRRFVSRYSGDDWEEFYESLFGYRAKLVAREEAERGELGKRRKRFRRWRDPLFEFCSSRAKAQTAHANQEHLERVEQKRFAAQGMSAEDATAQAKQIAAAMVRDALETRTLEMEQKLAVIDPAIAAEQKRHRIKQMLADAKNHVPSPMHAREKAWRWLHRLFGSRMRFIVGCLLVVGCLLWVRQNDLFSPDDLKTAGSDLMEGKTASIKDTLEAGNAKKSEPLKLPLIGALFSSFAPGVAGLLLLISTFVSGVRMSLVAIPAALVVLFGQHFGIPGIEAIGGPQTTCYAIGAILVVAGILLLPAEQIPGRH